MSLKINSTNIFEIAFIVLLTAGSFIYLTVTIIQFNNLIDNRIKSSCSTMSGSKYQPAKCEGKS